MTIVEPPEDIFPDQPAAVRQHLHLPFKNGKAQKTAARRGELMDKHLRAKRDDEV
jgi:hypothetical protein